ncbi:MAG TPA: PAS domain-containing sensor histidine kinase, partial [Acidobacteriota bacterium]|nr:PAS domain-containing sensor histidine kinase [Acidobacteriota bacterium]
MPPPKKSRLAHENRVLVYTLLSGLPAVILALWLMFDRSTEMDAKRQWTFGLIIVGFWFGYALAVREIVMRP